MRNNRDYINLVGQPMKKLILMKAAVAFHAYVAHVGIGASNATYLDYAMKNLAQPEFKVAVMQRVQRVDEALIRDPSPLMRKKVLGGLCWGSGEYLGWSKSAKVDQAVMAFIRDDDWKKQAHPVREMLPPDHFERMERIAQSLGAIRFRDIFARPFWGRFQ